ncbi:hypothetical protein [Dialister succinatiphilus]|uniref:hypothetical protein n=1 Tax=Dialister succinatiphilus TaxID=487173 RepID=UPI0026709C7A|nr:hypothetical protein [uncultured Dialister sp.]
MGKKRKYTPPTFETMHPEGRHVYMAIYDTLYTSPAWKELTDKQVRLYLFCRWQYWAKRENRPGADYPDYEPYQAPEVFYLNWAKVQSAGLYRSNKKRFYDDVRALCKRGLIESLYNGRGGRDKSVFRLSDLRQKYKAESET